VSVEELADAGDDVFYAEAEGDTDDVHLELGADELVMSQIGDDAHSLFSLDYLKDLQQPIPGDVEVSVRVGEELPTMLQYSLADSDVVVQNMVAPRIQSE